MRSPFAPSRGPWLALLCLLAPKPTQSAPPASAPAPAPSAAGAPRSPIIYPKRPRPEEISPLPTGKRRTFDANAPGTGQP